MAIYRLDIKSISRGAGRSAVAAAAYRAGERLRDERTGELHNYSRREDIEHRELMLPASLQGPPLAWAADRESLWNHAERAETRRNARVAREFQMALPAELSAAQRLALAQRFARELVDRQGIVVDLALHRPRPDGDERNYHAHLLATTREATPEGLGAKAGLDMSNEERRRRGLNSGLEEFNAIRERWATLTNEALHAAGIDARVDHRSLAQQGIERAPLHIPFSAVQMERRGLSSEVADRLREQYRARSAAHEAASTSTEHSAALSGASAAQARAQAREAWLKMRQELTPPAQREPDSDWAL